jgi:hypothetical protein
MIYNDNQYLNFLRINLKASSDVELFGLYNQIIRVQELILSHKDKTTQLDLAKKAITASLKGPNELRSVLINKFIKNDEKNENGTLYDLELANFLLEESQENFVWAYSLLFDAIEHKREQTALFLLKRFSFKHVPNENLKEGLFLLTLKSQMEKVEDAMFNKLLLDDKKEIYTSLQTLAKTVPSAAPRFLEKIQNSGCYDEKLQLNALDYVLNLAHNSITVFSYNQYPKIVPQYAKIVKAIYSSFAKNRLPTETATGVLKIETGTKILDKYTYTRYALAFSIQDMEFFKMVISQHPLDKTNPEHYKIIAQLVTIAPVFSEEIDTTQTSQNGPYQPYLWSLENQDNAKIDRFPLSYLLIEPKSTTNIKELLNYQKMISELLGNDPKELDKIMQFQDERGETIYNKWVQYLIDFNINPQTFQPKKKQKKQ